MTRRDLARYSAMTPRQSILCPNTLSISIPDAEGLRITLIICWKGSSLFFSLFFFLFFFFSLSLFFFFFFSGGRHRKLIGSPRDVDVTRAYTRALFPLIDCTCIYCCRRGGARVSACVCEAFAREGGGGSMNSHGLSALCNPMLRKVSRTQ